MVIGAHIPAEDIGGPEVTEIFNISVAGIVRVTHAFLPLLRRSEYPAVINVSSGMGSFALTHDPDRIESKLVSRLYTSSKSAVTMLTTQYARGLAGIRVNAADPGYTATDLNGNSGPQTVTEGTDARSSPSRRKGPRPARDDSSIVSGRSAGDSELRTQKVAIFENFQGYLKKDINVNIDTKGCM